MQNLNPILLVRSGMADINMKVASARDEEEKRNITRTHATPCRGPFALRGAVSFCIFF